MTRALVLNAYGTSLDSLNNTLSARGKNNRVPSGSFIAGGD
jgi:hypothetical protein